MSQCYNDYAQGTVPAISDAVSSRLRLSQSHDSIEHEADALAERALSGKVPQISMDKSGLPGHIGTNSLGGSGRALDADTRSFFEPRFGADFSTVRVHADDAAHARAMRMEARAYTYGRDIVFARGEYSPSTTRGRVLLGHELAHVMQQGTYSATAEVIARQPANNLQWLQDDDGALYYLTRAAAQRRLETLKETGEWEELRVASFERKHETYWRVEMRGRKKAPEQINGTLKGNAIKGGAIASIGDNVDVGAKKDASAKDSQGEADTDKAETGSSAPGSTVGASGGGATRTFSLTFDDGPHSAELGVKKNWTEKVLDTLKSKGVKAGFFIQSGVDYRGANKVGRKLVARMQAEGHTVGIHTGGKIEHELHPEAQKTGRLESELKDAKTYISEQTGTVPRLVRPPTGVTNAAVSATYKKVGLTNLLWDIDGDRGPSKGTQLKTLAELKTRLDSTDPKEPGIPAVHARGWTGMTPAHPKIVVLYHDIRPGTANNIGGAIDYIREVTKKVSGGKDTADFAPP